MKRILLILTVVLFPLFNLPQQAVAQQPPEAQRLEAFVGDWTYDNPLDGVFTCEWLGDLIVHCQSSWLDADGDTIYQVLLNRYDPEAEVYRSHRFYSGGYADSGLGWVDGNTWTFVYEGPRGARFRITLVIAEDNAAYEWHRSLEGGPWEAMGTFGSSGSVTRVR